MFEKASRLKLRFDIDRGNITVEDLWDLPLTSTRMMSLDDLAKHLNKAVKESAEESFVVEKSATNAVLELKFEIVKHVIAIKLADVEASKNAVDNKAKKDKILAVISAKEDNELEGQSMDDLKKMLAEL